MKKLLTSLIFIILVSCNQQIKESDLQYLNGYWEIEKVILADKSVKIYEINTTYDYIDLKNNNGFRKKVYPQLFGKYQTSEDAEFFSIVKKGNTWEMNYTSKDNKWVETLESLSEKSFTVKNTAGIEYFYKKVERQE